MRHDRRRTTYRPTVSLVARTSCTPDPAQGNTLPPLLRRDGGRGTGACGVACAARCRASLADVMDRTGANWRFPRLEAVTILFVGHDSCCRFELDVRGRPEASCLVTG